jgi:putative two-component system response regulator
MEKTEEKPVILVVDDTPDNIVLLSDVLRGRYKVEVANSGERCLKLAVKTLPDLILLDVMMPEMDGYAVCDRLKADPTTRDIPIIFLTARSDEEDERHGLLLGAVDYITNADQPRYRSHAHRYAVAPEGGHRFSQEQE